VSRNRFTSGSSIELLHTDGAFTPALDAYAGAGKVAALRRAFAYFGYNLEKSGAVRELVIDNLHGVELIGGAPLASGGCHTTPRAVAPGRLDDDQPNRDKRAGRQHAVRRGSVALTSYLDAVTEALAQLNVPVCDVEVTSSERILSERKSSVSGPTGPAPRSPAPPTTCCATWPAERPTTDGASTANTPSVQHRWRFNYGLNGNP